MTISRTDSFEIIKRFLVQCTLYSTNCIILNDVKSKTETKIKSVDMFIFHFSTQGVIYKDYRQEKIAIMLEERQKGKKLLKNSKPSLKVSPKY